MLQRSVVVAEGAAHERHIQQRQIGGGIVKPSAQQHQTKQALFPLHDGGLLQLIVAGTDLLHHHGVAAGGDARLHRVDDVGVEGIGDAAHHKSDGIRLGFHQIPGGVVGDVVGAFDHIQHLAAALVADIGAVVQHAGDGGDTDAAHAGNVLDRHVVSLPSFKSGRKRLGSVTGNVFNLSKFNISNFHMACQCGF